MGLYMGLVTLSRILPKLKPGKLPSKQSCDTLQQTAYREIPQQLTLQGLHLQNTEPMDSPEAVSAQVASLTMDVASILQRITKLEGRQNDGSDRNT